MDAAALLPYARNQLHPEALTWASSEEIDRWLLEDAREAVKWLYEDEYPTMYIGNCPVEGAQLDDYRNRLFDLSPGLTVSAGIRFKGLDMDWPFVGVDYQSRLFDSGRDLERLVDVLMEAFAVFRPRFVSIYQPSHVPIPESDALAVTEDQRYLAGPLARMRSLPEPPSLDRVRLAAATNLDFYPRYEATYRQLYGERSWLQEAAEAEEREDLEVRIGEGLAFEAFVDDAWAGLMVVAEGNLKGLRGYNVEDIVLNERARGAGLGVCVQRRLAELLDDGGGRVLHGTIRAFNAPARKTAARAGRLDIGGDIWIARRADRGDGPFAGPWGDPYRARVDGALGGDVVGRNLEAGWGGAR